MRSRTVFTTNEQKKIPKTLIKAETGNGTKDKVFLLSTLEANKYFNSIYARQCGATAYTQTRGNFTYANCPWWLCSLGEYGYGAMFVNRSGGIISAREEDINRGVRPAMWINVG